MTRKSLVTQAELKRMASIANAENVTVEIERDGTIVRVKPFRSTSKKSTEDEGEAAWEKWRRERAARALTDAPAPKSPRAGRRWGS